MPKKFYSDDPLTPMQQEIVNKLRAGYTLTKNKGHSATLHGNGYGPDKQVNMSSLNGAIVRRIIDEQLRLSSQAVGRDGPTRPGRSRR